MNTNNLKTQIFHKNKYDLKGHESSHRVILNFFFFFDLNTTLTYILMDNFCLCFNANNLCVPESINTNISHQLFDNKITFVNLHDFIIKTRFKTFVLKISGTKIKLN